MTINRRSALGLSLSALLASLASTSRAKSMAGKTVIVIGAGLAGLAAAQRLKSQGADVLVLEAGDYVGGRVRTNLSLGAPVEFGAGWIHGPSRRNPTKRLADQVGAKTFVTDDESFDLYTADGRSLTQAEWQRFETLFEALEHQVYGPVRRGQLSVRDLLARADASLLRDPLARWMISAYFEFDIGAEIADISAKNVALIERFAGEDVIITQGYDTIIAPLAEGLDIRLNQPVAQIRYDAQQVRVDGIAADYAICTVPLGVLKSGRIGFDPPLPARKSRAIAEVGFGAVTKIALKFAQPFWDMDTQYFGILSAPDGRWNYWMNYRKFSNENILLGLSFGAYARTADRMSQAQMTEDALDVLRGVWPGAVGKPLGMVTTRWSQDPHFLGTYSYPQAGGTLAQFDDLSEPLRKRVFFAGEHTVFEHLGTTHGALMSGRRAADAILRL